MRKTKNKWCCIQKNHKNPWFADYTIADSKKESIRMLCENSCGDWHYWRTKFGWKCVKVKVTIESI